jgi:DNA mismatch repair ATPase MutS
MINLYRILALIPFTSLFFAFFNAGLGVFIAIAAFITNMIIHFNIKSTIGWQLEVLAYIIGMVNKAKGLVKNDIPELEEYIKLLKANLKDIQGITRKTYFLFSINNGDFFTELFRILFLREVIEYETVMTTIHRYSENFTKIYETFGLLDSMISIASYRESLSYYSLPELCNSYAKQKRILSFTDLYHPLIDKPVPNSMQVEKSVLLTGSNASGKSTFLKTIAINAIFAQTIHTCLAKQYSSDYFMVYSSMALKDNLLGNESYFVVEIKSLKRILDYLNNNIPCLCFVDEVLRGTNTVERIAASSQILYHLSFSNCLCFAATHDIELSYILKERYDNYHFQERIEDGKIIFDYKLYDGRSSTRNAIKLLNIIGYDGNVVKKAEDMAKSFISKGKWEEVIE